MTEIEHQDDATPCFCCPEPIELGMRGYLSIHASCPQGDERLMILLYHNWVTPDTAYMIFGTTHRILGLFPPNPFIQWLRRQLEPEKPQN